MIDLPESYEDSEKEANRDEEIVDILTRIHSRAFCIVQRARLAIDDMDCRDKMIADIKEYIELLESEAINL